MPDLYFTTFGNQAYEQRKYILAHEISMSKRFTGLFIYGEKDLEHLCLEGETKGKHFQGQGAGFWWWKSFIIKESLKKIKEGDILLYLDAGFYFNRFANSLFDHYLDLLYNSDGFLAFGHLDPARCLTKRDLFISLDCDSTDFTDTSQIASGLILLRKNELAMKFSDLFYQNSLIDHNLNNDPSVAENYPNFKFHSHDQALLNLVVRKVYKDKKIQILHAVHQDSTLENYKTECDKLMQAIDILRNLKYPFYVARLKDYNTY